MENLNDQIFQATSTFIATVKQLTERHAASVLQETFSSLGNGKAPANGATSSGDRSRGAKRAPEELEQLAQRFVQFVSDNPGLRIEQINKQLGTTTTELSLPIRKLLADGVLQVQGQKRSTTYFVGKEKRSTKSAKKSKGTKSEAKAKGTTKKSAKKSKSTKKVKTSKRSETKAATEAAAEAAAE